MNGIEKIIARIESDCQAECQQILDAANTQAQQLISDAEQAAQREYGAIIAQGKRMAEQNRLLIVSAASAEAGRRILAVKQKMLDRAYDLAMEQLCALPEKAEFLAKLICRASTSGRETVIMNPHDRQSIGSQTVELANNMLAASGKPPELTLSERTGDFRGGFYLSAGNIETNCTFELLISKHRGSCAAETAKALFDEGE